MKNQQHTSKNEVGRENEIKRKFMIILIRQEIYGAKSEREEKTRHEKEVFLTFLSSHFEFILGRKIYDCRSDRKESDDTCRIFRCSRKNVK